MERVIEINKFKNSNGRKPITRSEYGSIVHTYLGALWGMAVMGRGNQQGSSETRPKKFAKAKRRSTRVFRNQNRS